MTTAQQQALASLQGIIGALRSPRARVELLGSSSCVGSNGAPTLSMTGTPRLGQTYHAALGNAPVGSAAWHLIGFSASDWNGLALPFDMSLIGSGSGCEILVAGQQAIAATTNGTGAASVAVSVPLRNELVGLAVLHQWIAADPAAPGNPLGLIATSAAASVVGL